MLIILLRITDSFQCIKNLTQADFPSNCTSGICTFTSFDSFGYNYCVFVPNLSLKGQLTLNNNLSLLANTMSISTSSIAGSKALLELNLTSQNLNLEDSQIKKVHNLTLDSQVLTMSASLQADFILINANKTLNSNGSVVVALYSVCGTSCNCDNSQICQNTQPFTPAFKLTQATLLINSSTIYSLRSAFIGSIVMLEAQTLTLYQSTVQSDAASCQTPYGYGCGVFSVALQYSYSCGSTGGSHGGRGGNASGLVKNQQCFLIQGRDIYQGAAGSAGGGTNSGNGGGLVFINAKYISLNNVTKISSNGGNGKYSSGGGSGGTVFVRFRQFQSQSSSIQAQGGRGGSLSGSGGGGQIYFFKLNWNQSQAYKPPSFNLAAGQASEENVGQHGIITTMPCPSMTYLKLVSCVPCEKGTVQYFPSFQQCIQCDNKPENSFYNQSGSCNYACNQGFMQYRGLCLDSLGLFFNKLYGLYLVSFFSVVIAFLISISTVLLVKYLTQAKNKLQIIGNYSNGVFINLLPQDLPYHKYRIFLNGRNTPNHPWHISEQSYKNVNDLFMESMQFNDVVKQLNSEFQYSKKIKWLLNITRVLYNPFYLILLKMFQIKRIYRVIVMFKPFERRVKFTYSARLTLASIDILSQEKSVLNFTRQCLFPLLLIPETSFLGNLIVIPDAFYKSIKKDCKEALSMGLDKILFRLLPQVNLKNSTGNFEMSICLLLNCLQKMRSFQKQIDIKFLLELNGDFYEMNDLLDFKRWYTIKQGRLILFLTLLDSDTSYKRFLYMGVQYLAKQSRPAKQIDLSLASESLLFKVIKLFQQTLVIFLSEKSLTCNRFYVNAGILVGSLVEYVVHIVLFLLYIQNCKYFLICQLLIMPLLEQLTLFYWIRSIFFSKETVQISLICSANLIIKNTLLFALFFAVCQSYSPLMWSLQALQILVCFFVTQLGRMNSVYDEQKL